VSHPRRGEKILPHISKFTPAIIKHHVMKAHGKMEVLLHACLTSALGNGRILATVALFTERMFSVF